MKQTIKITACCSAKDAYVAELEAARAKIGRLQSQLNELIGNGTVSDKVNWAHVGDLKHLNQLLDEALAAQPARVK